MKLGISINLFDCEELLLPQLINIRSFVDYISIITQKISNHGNQANDMQKVVLDKCLQLNLVDDIFWYEPDLKTTTYKNELSKRNKGLELAKNNDCTHFISMDADEFYSVSQLEQSKRYIEEKDCVTTVCHIQDYYSKPIYKISNFASYYVPFIMKILPDSEYSFGVDFKATVDPTRRINGGKIEYMKSDMIVMHHMSWVRANYDNLVKKFVNSSSARDVHNPIGLSQQIWNYRPENHVKEIHPQIEITEDVFNIEYYLERYRNNEL